MKKKEIHLLYLMIMAGLSFLSSIIQMLSNNIVLLKYTTLICFGSFVVIAICYYKEKKRK
ncbi:hypothetical protein [Anaerosporobacter sp.]|uniref:hypothetical protein n=1 Tax=Anaerosporobacter sp. TaxID=1872529 RepID=UPI00286F01D8|nr:hypothetical protein [Anaerosporobacter sp.]